MLRSPLWPSLSGTTQTGHSERTPHINLKAPVLVELFLGGAHTLYIKCLVSRMQNFNQFVRTSLSVILNRHLDSWTEVWTYRNLDNWTEVWTYRHLDSKIWLATRISSSNIFLQMHSTLQILWCKINEWKTLLLFIFLYHGNCTQI